jgi:hypothetical protein
MKSIPRRADNSAVAERLREAAVLLQAQGASPYRVRAYREAAQSVEGMARDVRAVFDAGGVKALDALPKVGLGIASAIAEMLVRGRWAMLDRLRGLSDPVVLLRTVPGIGESLAELIHHRLNVDSLEQLEQAAHDGRLSALPQVGERRAASIRASVAAMLGRPFERTLERPRAEPDVATLLSVDREYRERSARGELKLIAPRRFNPDAAAWLPILHTKRGDWHFTAIYSNTALAHKLGRIHDWVVVYYYDADHVESCATIVTEHRGPLAGQRVVRGREDECVKSDLLDPPQRAAAQQGYAGWAGLVSGETARRIHGKHHPQRSRDGSHPRTRSLPRF